MPVRTTQTTVTFRKPFHLACYGRDLPAGDYVVETDEDLVPGVSFTVYRRVGTILHIAARNGNPAMTRTVTVNGTELDDALAHDAREYRVLTDSAAAPHGDPSEGTPRQAPSE